MIAARRPRPVLAPSLALLVAAPLLAADPSGRDIAARVRDANRSDTEVATFEMKMVDAGGKEKVRKLSSWAATPKGGPDKALMRFLDPPDVAGTSVLTLEQPGKEDEQWMYLPALKRTRRIAGTQRKDSFMGSDLSYDDLRPREVDAYTYTVLKSEKLPDGDAWVLEAVPVKGGKADGGEYARTLSWIRKDDYVPLKGEMYGADGSLLKTVSYGGYTSEAGVKRPSSVEVLNRKKGSRTSIRYLERKLDEKLDDGMFSSRALEMQAP